MHVGGTHHEHGRKGQLVDHPRYEIGDVLLWDDGMGVSEIQGHEARVSTHFVALEASEGWKACVVCSHVLAG